MTSALANAQVPNYLMHNGMVIRCSSFVGQNERTTKHDPQMAKYDATPGYVIVSYNSRVVDDLGNTTWSLSNVQANSSVIDQTQLATAHNFALSYLSSINIPGLIKAEVSQDFNTSYAFTQSTLNQLQVSNAGLLLKTDAWGAGRATFKGRNLISVEISDVLEMEIPACFKSQTAMQAKLKSDIDSGIARWKIRHKWDHYLCALAAFQFSHVTRGLNRVVGMSTRENIRKLVMETGDPVLGKLPIWLPPKTPVRPPSKIFKEFGVKQSSEIDVPILTDEDSIAMRRAILTAPKE